LKILRHVKFIYMHSYREDTVLGFPNGLHKLKQQITSLTW